MSYATRNENGDNMGNTFVRAPLGISREEFADRWDNIFKNPSASVKAHTAGGMDVATSSGILHTSK